MKIQRSTAGTAMAQRPTTVMAGRTAAERTALYAELERRRRRAQMVARRALDAPDLATAPAPRRRVA